MFGSDASKEHTGPLSEKRLKTLQDVYATVIINNEYCKLLQSELLRIPMLIFEPWIKFDIYVDQESQTMCRIQ